MTLHEATYLLAAVRGNGLELVTWGNFEKLIESTENLITSMNDKKLKT